MIEYINVFHSSSSVSPKVFRFDDSLVTKSKCGRGALVKRPSEGCDYLINGKLVTQRAGASLDLLDELIGIVLDGEEPKSYLDANAKKVYDRNMGMLK